MKGTSKKKRQQWKSAKGQKFSRKKPGFEQKKKFLKFVYAGNFGNNMSSLAESVEDFLYSQNRIIKERKMTNAKKAFEQIERHYNRIKNLPEYYKKDPDFRTVVFWLKKHPELKSLFNKFKRNPSQKTADQINKLVTEIRDQGVAFDQVAMKYGILERIQEDTRMNIK